MCYIEYDNELSKNITTLFNTFIYPSISKLIEDMNLKIFTSRLYLKCLSTYDNSSKFTLDISFLPNFNTQRNEALLKQKLQGKLLYLFSEYGICVDKIEYNYKSFPDIHIAISIDELMEYFKFANEHQENFTVDSVYNKIGE